MLRRFSALVLPVVLAVSALSCLSQSTASQKPSTIITASEAGSILPPSVFFRGQSASVQARNSAGIRLSKDSLLLVALVDASGYSSSIQQKYQAYLITESTVEIGGHRLAPGAYGCGFIAEDTFLVMDIGGHDLFTTKSTRDADLHRPMPLQILQASTAGKYRLYAGRNFVEISPTPSASQ
ncbi:MAG TPA: hypothetical protein VGG95_08735 [Edaphobacter sp.]|jgi:hypothetical protein